MKGRFLVVGLRRSGLAACEAIARVWPEAQVVAADPAQDVDRGRLSAAGAEYVGGGEELSMSGVRALIKSPGVAGEATLVEAARAAGVPVWSEVELASRMLPNPIVGITGTNGKTTTTELVGRMLDAAGMPVEVAGNVGRALSELPGRIAPDAWIACELSSFQLEDIDTLRCRVGVLLNITPDHLDRHRSMDEYVRCKLRILENQTASDTAVVNADDPCLARARLPGAGRRFWFAKDDRSNLPWPVPGLRGDHNLENALGAAAAARAAGAPPEAIATALADYRPPVHRMQPVAEARGVTFVNDSKATNPDATVKALTAYEGGVRLILGGSLKGGSFVDLARAVARGPVSRSYLIGQAAPTIAAQLQREGADHRRCGTLDVAVRQAAADAVYGDVVLLSPACASFDQFRDYAHRGEEFTRIAEELTDGR
ncbi:MAG TPA: UDP-N-acetylmuramoyl-L-alanine--D-glutamate ligase [Gaiellales bacterium]|nr:UDP-N-acetylmuramoyl-L-alanine--D-glutamate ligase [Gaiellales bacterium]